MNTPKTALQYSQRDFKSCVVCWNRSRKKIVLHLKLNLFWLGCTEEKPDKSYLCEGWALHSQSCGCNSEQLERVAIYARSAIENWSNSISAKNCFCGLKIAEFMSSNDLVKFHRRPVENLISEENYLWFHYIFCHGVTLENLLNNVCAAREGCVAKGMRRFQSKK